MKNSKINNNFVDKIYYDTLGVDRSITAEKLKSKYKKLVVKYHPDINKSKDATRKLQDINIAYAYIDNILKGKPVTKTKTVIRQKPKPKKKEKPKKKQERQVQVEKEDWSSIYNELSKIEPIALECIFHYLTKYLNSKSSKVVITESLRYKIIKSLIPSLRPLEEISRYFPKRYIQNAIYNAINIHVKK